MASPLVITCEDPDALADKTADLIIESSYEAIKERGRFTIALTGGTTPKKTYERLAMPDRLSAIDWSRTYVFMSDERFVPLDDPRSNFGMAQKALLSHVPVHASHVFPPPTHLPTAAEAAAKYERDLAAFFFPGGAGGLPRFDLMLLGMGDDGHVASLFPGASALQVADAWVTSSPPGTLPPPVDRITFTYPVLNAARVVAFLVAGEKKAVALRDILDNDAPLERRPAAGVHPISGALIWLLDREAAHLLNPR